MTIFKWSGILLQLFDVIQSDVLLYSYVHQMNRQISELQSTLVISKSKGSAETLRDIRTSTYQMCRIEENTKRTTKFHT